MLGIIAFATGVLVGAAIVFAGWNKKSFHKPLLIDELYDEISSTSEQLALHISRLQNRSKEIEDGELRILILTMIGYMMVLSDSLRYQRYLLLKQIYKDL